MKTTKNNSTIAEIDHVIALEIDFLINGADRVLIRRRIADHIKTALASQHESDIQAFKEIIGEDELHIGGFADANNDLIVNRNRLRAELRKKLDALLK